MTDAAYIPSPVPQTGNPSLERYVEQELEKIKQAVGLSQDFIKAYSRDYTPDKPRDGLIFVAIDTHDPGLGQGVYYYRDGSYYLLSETVVP